MESYDKTTAPVMLDKGNIIVNCPSEGVIEAITRSGKLLVNAGYATHRYIEGMIKRNDSLSVAIGCSIAIPHGDNEYKSEILHTGLVVCAYPEGIDWDGENVNLVIGIAALGNQHIDILGRIATYFGEDQEAATRLAKSGDVEEIYKILTE